jgi:DtxR family Mn-dependent transcriptional regulator
VRLNQALASDRPLSHAVQDYLKSIYVLTESGLPASTTALAARLGVAPASVTGMIQKLASARPPLVHYRKHQGTQLTSAGRRAALEVIRHHRLLEAWLVQTLGYAWDDVHIEAEVMEHVISEEFEQRIAAALGDPSRDPHGEPIPSVRLEMPRDLSRPLSDLQPSQEGIVRRVEAEDRDLLRQLDRIGLSIGTRVRVVGVSPHDHGSRLQVGNGERDTVIGPEIAGRVFVELVKKGGRRATGSQP